MMDQPVMEGVAAVTLVVVCGHAKGPVAGVAGAGSSGDAGSSGGAVKGVAPGSSERVQILGWNELR